MLFNKKILSGIALILLPFSLYASANTSLLFAGIRLEFIIFALTLLGVALFHHHTMYVALSGLLAVLILKFTTDQHFDLSGHLFGNEHHEGEWKTLVNLIGLLFGFGILAKLFEDSKIPEKLPNILPDDWKGGFMLLFIIMILSSFLDNIAAAMIGGTIALVVFKNKIHIGFLAAIIAASNAGGAGSVVGDTTTTIMWIDGVSPITVLPAFIASIAAFLFFGIIASKQQHRFNPIQKDSIQGVKIDYQKIVVVIFILISAILTNYFLDFPAIGVWCAIIMGTLITSIPWHELKPALPGTIFLTALVMCASLMPVNDLPTASWQTALSLGFISALFDNIPLTKLCLEQGGYDWGILAYCVGFGGSMLWFGSSAGVALTSKFPEGRSVVKYVSKGWHIIIAYVIGFFALYLSMGWVPSENHREKHEVTPEKYIAPNQYNPSST